MKDDLRMMQQQQELETMRREMQTNGRDFNKQNSTKTLPTTGLGMLRRTFYGCQRIIIKIKAHIIQFLLFFVKNTHFMQIYHTCSFFWKYDEEGKARKQDIGFGWIL